MSPILHHRCQQARHRLVAIVRGIVRAAGSASLGIQRTVVARSWERQRLASLRVQVRSVRDLRLSKVRAAAVLSTRATQRFRCSCRNAREDFNTERQRPAALKDNNVFILSSPAPWVDVLPARGFHDFEW